MCLFIIPNCSFVELHLGYSLVGLLVGIGALHIGLPFFYVGAMRRVASQRTYGLSLSSESKPSVTVLVPVFNESNVIVKKLEDLSETTYPRERLQIIVADDGSTDDTSTIASETLRRLGLDGLVVRQTKRQGKVPTMNHALSLASKDLLCISDADCLWDKSALENASRYFSDPSVGSVSGVPEVTGPAKLLVSVEKSYRSVYKSLRIGESKLHSTPIAEGEIQLFRRRDFDFFDPKIGADDTAAGLKMVAKGFRAISAEDVIFYEHAPTIWHDRFAQKVRRGQHVLQAFTANRRLLFRKPSIFSRLIFPMEFFLHGVSPLLFVPFIVLLILLFTSHLFLFVAGVFAATFVVSVPYLRITATTYVSNNLIMLAAILQELRGKKNLIWNPIAEIRTRGSA